MPLLALDTATATPVAALCADDGTLLAGGTIDGRAQRVLVLIDELCSEAGVARSDLSAIVVGTGPGTFTGLRVGVATARGLAEALRIPLHGASSLDVVAASAPDDADEVAIEAGRGERFVRAVAAGSPVRVLPCDHAPPSTTPTPAGLARAAAARRAAALAAHEDGIPLHVLPAYGREPDAAPPRMDIVLDVLGSDDLDALLTLEERCFDHPWTRGMYQGELDRPAGDAVRLAARDRGANARLVGAALAARIGGAWHVMNVLVDPAARGRGIGQLLVDRLLERTRALGAGEGWTLEVRDGNAPAIGLYERSGFEHAGRRPGYYRDTGDDALVMWRRA